MKRVEFFNFYKNVQKSWELYSVTLDQILEHIGSLNEAFYVSHLDKYINEETHPIPSINNDDYMYFWEHGDYIQFDYKKELAPFPPKEYSEQKLTIPCVVFNSYSRQGHRVNAKSSPTQVIYLDIDNIYDQSAIPDLKKELVNRFPIVKACWKSLSGYGIGFIVQCSGVTKSNYENAFDQLKQLIDNEYLNTIGLEIDQGSKGFSQPTILPYDPEILIIDNPESFSAKKLSKVTIQETKTQSTFNLDDYSLPSKEDVLNAILKTTDTYYSIYRRYLEDVSDIDEFKRVFVQQYSLNQVDYNTYTTLCGENSHIYDAGERLPITYPIYFDSKIKEGNRTKMIGAFGMKLIFNNPFTKTELLLKHLNSFNGRYFDPPLKPKEVYNSFIYNYKKYLAGELDFSSIIKKFVYGLFDRDADEYRSNIDVGKMKQKLGTHIYQENHKQEQIERILKAKHSLIEKNIKPTQSNLSNESGIKSRKTIRKYLNMIESKNG